MRERFLAQALIAIGFACAARTATAQEQGEAPAEAPHGQMRAEIGAEYDSNAHRVEQITSSGQAVVGSFLQRLVLSAQALGQIAPRHALAWSATGAAKIFDAPAARSENVVIAQSSLVWRATLGERTWLAPSASYYEAFQSWTPEGDPAGERRDFRSLAPTVELRRGVSESVELGLAAGYRWLLFKPDRDFDFDGPTAGVNLRWFRDTESGADWEARAGAAIEHRGFAGPALVGNCMPDSLPCPGPAKRNDDFVMAQAELTRTGRVLLGAGYAFQHNGSNSYGDTLVRHYAIARVAAALPLGLYLAARGDLLFAFYRDAVPIARADVMQMSAAKPYNTYEEENRSTVRVDLSRDIGDRLRLVGRYTFYANELGSNAGTYRRHTLLLSLSYGWER